MNTQIAKGAITQFKGELKQKWAKFTDDDVSYLGGNVEEITGRLQKAYGYSKERAQTEFEEFKNKHSNFFRDDNEKKNTGEQYGKSRATKWTIHRS